MNIGWAFVIPVGASLVLMAAACGMMMSNGLVKDSPAGARLSIVFLLFAGVETALLLIGYGLSLLPSAGEHFKSTVYRDYAVTKEGKIFLKSENEDGSAMSLTDIHGTPITDDRYVGNNSFSAFCQFTPICWNGFEDEDLSDGFLVKRPRQMANYLRVANRNSYESPEVWYIRVSGNYFAGYDKLSRRCVGICDNRGFHPAGATPEPFPVPLKSANYNDQPPFLFHADGQLYGLDFSERSITPLLKSEAIHGAEGLRSDSGKRLFIGVALKTEIQVLDPHGKPIVAIPYGHDPSIWPGIWLTTIPTADRIFVKYEPRGPWGAARSIDPPRPTFVDEVDLNGKLIQSYSELVRPFASVEPGWADRAASCALPLAPAALWKLSSLVFPKKEDSFVVPNYGHALLHVSLAELCVLLGISAALGISAYFWARNVGFTQTKARWWGAFVFCLGLPGFVAFRLAADWPTRVRCPNCSGKRSIDAEECPHCHQPWAAPELNGTEIFNLAAN
jgi:hypothetical protein